MRFSKVVLAFIALCSPLELHAQCFICDEVVEMNAAGAACFLEKRSEYEAELQSGSDGFVEVNLNECIGTDVSASRGGEIAEDFSNAGPQAVVCLRWDLWWCTHCVQSSIRSNCRDGSNSLV